VALSTPPRLVLDTSAYSRMRRGHPEVLSLLAAAETVLVPAIVLGELEAGFRLGTRAAENRVILGEFLDEPFTAVLEVTSAAAVVYGELFAQLREAGTPIPINDVWIAACAVEARAHLVTFDRDFERIRDLKITVLRDAG
jgi:tRNA(fMet)-specific endonuclease VapC